MSSIAYKNRPVFLLLCGQFVFAAGLTAGAFRSPQCLTEDIGICCFGALPETFFLYLATCTLCFIFALAAALAMPGERPFGAVRKGCLAILALTPFLLVGPRLPALPDWLHHAAGIAIILLQSAISWRLVFRLYPNGCNTALFWLQLAATLLSFSFSLNTHCFPFSLYGQIVLILTFSLLLVRGLVDFFSGRRVQQ
ncbi:MAG: hypothetical protein WCK76_15125 [Elusimicrobiota bacterium]